MMAKTTKNSSPDRSKAPKKRLDNLLVEAGLVPDCSKAMALIMAGEVYIGGKRADKPSEMVTIDAEIEIRSKRPDFVSRGGLKLEHALNELDLDVRGLICVDVGASTGGFTDCLLKKGAKKVYAIDVGYGQLDWNLRNDSRVVNLEKNNIRRLDTALIVDEIDLVVIDVSFIGLEKVFPKVDEIVSKNGVVIALIKPQFQVAKDKVGKGGVVKSQEYREEAIRDVKKAAADHGWKFSGIVESPIKGPKGNVEYLAHFIISQ